MQCGGLVSQQIHGLISFGIPVMNRVRGAFVFGPDGNELTLRASGDKGIVIDRTEFDRNAARWAVDRGTDLRLGTRVKRLTISRDGVVAGVGGGKEYRSELVLGGEGTRSITAGSALLPPVKDMISGFEIEAVGIPRSPEMVEVFTGQRFGEGFFSWIIPTGEESMRIGCGIHGSSRTALDSLRYLLKRSHHRERFSDIQPLSYHAGGIPLGIRRRIYALRSLVMGDAAGIAKPVSGGGIINGLISARIAAEVTGSCLDKGIFSAKVLSKYQTKLLRHIGKELKRAWRLRKAFMHLPDTELDQLFSLLSKPEIIALINERGDIDYPGRIALDLIRTSPRALKYAIRYLGTTLID